MKAAAEIVVDGCTRNVQCLEDNSRDIESANPYKPSALSTILPVVQTPVEGIRAEIPELPVYLFPSSRY